MGRPKKRVKSNGYILKSKGLIPKTWDLRKKLTDYQKRVVSERSREFADVIKYPSDYQSRTYGKKKVAQLKDAGFLTRGTRALIPFRTKRSNGAIVTNSFQLKGNTLVIDRSGRIETVYLNTGPEFLKFIDANMDTVLPRGEFWALKIGDSNTFLESHTKTIRELIRYGEEVNFHDPEARNYVHLVHIKLKNYG